MTLFRDISMAARIARRDMRGGVRALWLLVGGIFIGAAAMALVGTTSQSLINGANRGALEAVGGDLSLRLFHRPPSRAELAIIHREGDVSITAELRPMARGIKSSQANGKPILVELKGVDKQYPLYGTAKISPPAPLHKALNKRNGMYGAVADPALFDRLGLAMGDQIQIGKTRYQVRGTLESEPDRSFRAFTLGPRIIVAMESLASTGAADVGADVYYYTRVRIVAKSAVYAAAKAALARIDEALPQSGWRMVNAHDGVPGMGRTLAMAHVLLLFIGLGVMLVGGAGISGAVRAHVSEKMETVAILKSIGAPPSVVSMAIGLEVMATACIGTVMGVALGAFGPVAIALALSNQLPFTLDVIPSIKSLLATGLFSILIAALFAWWPLMAVQNLSARVLLRERIIQAPGKLRAPGWIGIGTILSLLVALVFWVSPMPLVTAGFLVGALTLATLYYALGVALARLAKRLARGKGAHVRQALGNLYRTGAPTGPVVMALGLTLTLLVALDGIGSAVGRHVTQTIPASAPDLVAFSLKPQTAQQLSQDLAASGVIERQRIMPFLHARVQAIGGTAVRQLDIPGSMRWVIRGDRGVSFADELPGGARWDKAQSKISGFSVDESVAKTLGLGLGDTITLNVSGHVRSGQIIKLHQVDWTGLDLDFPIIATPHTFEGIPHTYAASLKAKPGKEASLERLIKERFPDTPLIRVVDILHSLSYALGAIVTGLQSAALMCGVAALVVLAGSVLQGLRERTLEAILFKVLGASRGQLLGQVTMEFLGLGVLVALTAVPLGKSIAYGVALAARLGHVSISWTGGFDLAAAAILITLAVGLGSTLSAYKASPARILRSRSP